MIVAVQFLHPQLSNVELKATEFRFYGDDDAKFLKKALRYCTAGVDYRVRVYTLCLLGEIDGGLIFRDFSYQGCFDELAQEKLAEAMVKAVRDDAQD